MPRIAFATCSVLPEPDVDEGLLLEACRGAGLDAECVPWDDFSIDWAAWDLVSPRSTWNYYLHESAFREWICRVDAATKLQNPADMMLNTIHKGYLGKLAAGGVPIVPTRYVSVGSNSLANVLSGVDWPEVVIKPAVSAASFMTRRLASHDPAATDFLGQIVSSRDAMIQPYLPRVADGGEIALVHIHGELTHGIIKHPRFEDGVESVAETATEPTAAQRAVAKAALAQLDQPWLYARVDLMQADDGSWLLSELELIEPSLFLLQHPPALDRFIDAMKLAVGGASA